MIADLFVREPSLYADADEHHVWHRPRVGRHGNRLPEMVCGKYIFGITSRIEPHETADLVWLKKRPELLCPVCNDPLVLLSLANVSGGEDV